MKLTPLTARRLTAAATGSDPGHSWSGKRGKRGPARSVCRMNGRREREREKERGLPIAPGKARQACWRNRGLSRSFSVFFRHLFLVCVPLVRGPRACAGAARSLSLSLSSLSLVIPLALGSRRKVFQGDETRRSQLREGRGKRDDRPTGRGAKVGKAAPELDR